MLFFEQWYGFLCLHCYKRSCLCGAKIAKQINVPWQTKLKPRRQSIVFLYGIIIKLSTGIITKVKILICCVYNNKVITGTECSTTNRFLPPPLFRLPLFYQSKDRRT